MQFATIVLLFAGLTSTYGAPAALDPAQQEFKAEVQKALAPVQAEMRALVQNAQAAAEDLTKGVQESGSNILQAGRSLLSPVPAEKMDRANIGNELVQRSKEFRGQLEANARSLIERAIKDVGPVVMNERSTLFNVNDGISLLGKKYLTEDGQALAKALFSVVQH